MSSSTESSSDSSEESSSTDSDDDSECDIKKEKMNSSTESSDSSSSEESSLTDSDDDSECDIKILKSFGLSGKDVHNVLYFPKSNILVTFFGDRMSTWDLGKRRVLNHFEQRGFLKDEDMIPTKWNEEKKGEETFIYPTKGGELFEFRVTPLEMKRKLFYDEEEEFWSLLKLNDRLFACTCTRESIRKKYENDEDVVIMTYPACSIKGRISCSGFSYHSVLVRSKIGNYFFLNTNGRKSGFEITKFKFDETIIPCTRDREFYQHRRRDEIVCMDVFINKQNGREILVAGTYKCLVHFFYTDSKSSESFKEIKIANPQVSLNSCSAMNILGHDVCLFVDADSCMFFVDLEDFEKLGLSLFSSRNINRDRNHDYQFDVTVVCGGRENIDVLLVYRNCRPKVDLLRINVKGKIRGYVGANIDHDMEERKNYLIDELILLREKKIGEEEEHRYKKFGIVRISVERNSSQPLLLLYRFLMDKNEIDR